MAIRLPKEKDILKAIREWLDLKRIFYLRNNTGMLPAGNNRRVKFGSPGSSDLILCIRGTFVAVEVKGPSGQTTGLQESWLAAVRSAGGVAVVARSVQELEAALEERGLLQ